MYKNFEPHKFYKPISFNYTSNKIELWQAGQMKSNDSFLTSISCIEENYKMKITFKGETFNRFVDNELIFDKIFSLHDRLVLVTMPEESTLDVIGMSALRTTCGITRLGKRFSTNEPFCCSLFFVENAIDLVTFSFNNPEKLLEFYK